MGAQRGEVAPRLTIAPRSTAVIAEELRREVQAAEADFQSAVRHAIRAGELLIEAKAQVKHGEWLLWLEANFPDTRRSAQRYMRLAENATRVSHLPTVRDAVAALAEAKQIEAPKPDAPPEPKRVWCPDCGRYVRLTRPHECRGGELSDRKRAIGDAEKGRIEKGLIGPCQAFARGLPDMKVELAAAVSTGEEINAWVEEIDAAIAALQEFKRRITATNRGSSA